MAVVSTRTNAPHTLHGARFHPLVSPRRGARENSLWRVRIDPGSAREIVRPPTAQHFRFAGLTYALDSYEEEGRLVLERRLAPLGSGFKQVPGVERDSKSVPPCNWSGAPS